MLGRSLIGPFRFGRSMAWKRGHLPTSSKATICRRSPARLFTLHSNCQSALLLFCQSPSRGCREFFLTCRRNQTFGLTISHRDNLNNHDFKFSFKVYQTKTEFLGNCYCTVMELVFQVSVDKSDISTLEYDEV